MHLQLQLNYFPYKCNQFQKPINFKFPKTKHGDRPKRRSQDMHVQTSAAIFAVSLVPITGIMLNISDQICVPCKVIIVQRLQKEWKMQPLYIEYTCNSIASISLYEVGIVTDQTHIQSQSKIFLWTSRTIYSRTEFKIQEGQIYQD